MTDQQIIERKILLKNQAVQYIKGEIRVLRVERDLLRVRSFFEKRIDHSGDQESLSRCLDMIEVLLEAVRDE